MIPSPPSLVKTPPGRLLAESPRDGLNGARVISSTTLRCCSALCICEACQVPDPSPAMLFLAPPRLGTVYLCKNTGALCKQGDVGGNVALLAETLCTNAVNHNLPRVRWARPVQTQFCRSTCTRGVGTTLIAAR